MLTDGLSLRYDALKIVIMTRAGPPRGSARRRFMISEDARLRDFVNVR